MTTFVEVLGTYFIQIDKKKQKQKRHNSEFSEKTFPQTEHIQEQDVSLSTILRFPVDCCLLASFGPEQSGCWFSRSLKDRRLTTSSYFTLKNQQQKKKI